MEDSESRIVSGGWKWRKTYLTDRKTANNWNTKTMEANPIHAAMSELADKTVV